MQTEQDNARTKDRANRRERDGMPITTQSSGLVTTDAPDFGHLFIGLFLLTWRGMVCRLLSRESLNILCASVSKRSGTQPKARDTHP